MKKILAVSIYACLYFILMLAGCKASGEEAAQEAESAPEVEVVYGIDNSFVGRDVYINVSPEMAKAGETVTVTVVKTEPGIDTVPYVDVYDEDGNRIAHFPGDTGGTFVMPASNVKIETIFIYRDEPYP